MADPAPRPDPPTRNGKPPSAVLVPVFPGEAGPEIILTRRAWTMRSHAGQLAFPGGRREPGDSDLAHTALRETEEEIGLDPGAVQIVGELERLTTVTSPANIVPFLGVLEAPPGQLVASAAEVDAIVTVSLAELLDPAIYREEIWFQNAGAAGDFFEGIPITFFELVGDTLWGATARIVRTVLEQLAMSQQ